MSRKSSSKVDEQFNYVNNIYIILSAAILTFLVNLSFKSDIVWGKLSKLLICISTITIFVSLLTGVYLSLYRIENYRLRSKLNDKDNLDEVTKRQNVKNVLVSEKKKRRLLKYQGYTLLLSSFLMLVFALISIWC